MRLLQDRQELIAHIRAMVELYVEAPLDFVGTGSDPGGQEEKVWRKGFEEAILGCEDILEARLIGTEDLCVVKRPAQEYWQYMLKCPICGKVTTYCGLLKEDHVWGEFHTLMVAKKEHPDTCWCAGCGFNTVQQLVAYDGKNY